MTTKYPTCKDLDNKMNSSKSILQSKKCIKGCDGMAKCSDQMANSEVIFEKKMLAGQGLRMLIV